MNRQYHAQRYLDEAEEYYRLMWEVQVQIGAMEQEALRLAGGDQIAAAKNYLDRKDNDASWKYKNLCSTRDMWMRRAEVAAALAVARKIVANG